MKFLNVISSHLFINEINFFIVPKTSRHKIHFLFIGYWSFKYEQFFLQHVIDLEWSFRRVDKLSVIPQRFSNRCVTTTGKSQERSLRTEISFQSPSRKWVPFLLNFIGTMKRKERNLTETSRSVNNHPELSRNSECFSGHLPIIRLKSSTSLRSRPLVNRWGRGTLDSGSMIDTNREWHEVYHCRRKRLQTKFLHKILSRIK